MALHSLWGKRRATARSGFHAPDFKSSGLVGNKALISWDGAWKDFTAATLVPEDMAMLDDAALCEVYGIDSAFSGKVVSRRRRHRGLAHLNEARIT